MLRLLALLGPCLGIAVAQSFNTSSFQGEFADSGVIQSLRPTSEPGFDFSPSQLFSQRNGNGNNHLGDVIISYRSINEEAWANASTAANRSVPVKTLPASGSALLVSDLSAVIPGAVLNITRTWSEQDGDVALTFNITNISPNAIEIGALGFPIEFNSIFTNQAAANVLQTCSLIDPYIGLDAGYVQVTRLNGTGPNLVLTPFTNSTKLEAWEFLPESSGSLHYQSTSFEGFYAWQVYSQALADTQWGDAEPWNPPTSYTLAPGESQTYGLQITIAPQVYEIESTVKNLGHPTVVGIPGYILPFDISGSLYINSSSPPSRFEVTPTGWLEIAELNPAPSSPWRGYSVRAKSGSFGRARLLVSYADGTQQAVHYWIAHHSYLGPELIGNHTLENQWYTDTSDPFKRAPSIISWDKTTGSYVLQDNRAWIAGLSDEGGAGSFVTLAMKQVVQPVHAEVAALEEFVNTTVARMLQPSGAGTWAVKKSSFFYQPNAVPGYVYNPSINWAGAWNENAAYLTNRAYDYVWVSVLYWSLYKANRIAPGILSYNTPDWYLEQSYHSVVRGLNASTSAFTSLGLMGESLWGDLLQDLRAENMITEANTLQNIFEQRQKVWSTAADPFGSEQPWDCTGQEGVYYWSQYFNDSATALKTVQSIRGYDPTVAHWAYNGNARRYWDFTTAGEMSLSRIERQVHHYGSGLNALALLDWFRRSASPTSAESFYDLRVGYGGYLGPLSSIDKNGFTSMAFHSFAQTLAWDNYTGDYGPNFLGHAQASGAYLVQHPEFGWTAFGGNVAVAQDSVSVYPRDTLRRRFFASNIGLYIELEAGMIESATWSQSHQTLTLNVVQDSAGSTDVVMFYSITSATASGQVTLETEGLSAERGGYLVHIPAGGTAVVSWQVSQ